MPKFLISAFVAAFLLAVPVYAFPQPEADLYVYDPQGYLSASTRSYVVNESKTLRRDTGAEIVVGVIDSLPRGYDYLDDYAYDWFDEWGIGDAERNNGVMLVMLPSQEKAWLVTGGGLAAYLSDDKVNELLDLYFWSSFDAYDYGSAVVSLVRALSVELYKIYPVGAEYYEETTTTTTTTVVDDYVSDSYDYYDYGEQPYSESAIQPGIVVVAVIVIFAIIFTSVIIAFSLIDSGGAAYYPDDYAGPRYRRSWYRPSTWRGANYWHHRHGGTFYPPPSYGGHYGSRSSPPSRQYRSTAPVNPSGNVAANHHESSRHTETTTTTTTCRTSAPSFTPSQTNSYGFGGGSSSRAISSGFGGGGSSRGSSSASRPPSSSPSSSRPPSSSSSASRPPSSSPSASRPSSSNSGGGRPTSDGNTPRGGGGSSRGGGGGRR